MSEGVVHDHDAVFVFLVDLGAVDDLDVEVRTRLIFDIDNTLSGIFLNALPKVRVLTELVINIHVCRLLKLLLEDFRRVQGIDDRVKICLLYTSDAADE